MSYLCFFLYMQKTAYEMRISDWSSDVCSSDLFALAELHQYVAAREHRLITDQLRATALLPCPYRVGTVEHLHAGIRTCCRTVQRTANQIGSASCRARGRQ